MTNRSLDLPFTELYERVMEQVRENSDEPEIALKFQKIVNQIYQFDMPNYYEWDFLRRNAFITLVAEHTTGNVTISDGDTTVNGGSTSPAFTSAMTGRRFKFGGNDEIYDFTFVSSTSGTISPAFIGDDITDGSYKIFEDIYDLEDDFSWHTTEPSFYYDVSGGTQNVIWLDEEEWNERFTTTSADFATYFREFPTRTSLGKYQVQISPVPEKARLLRYDYLKLLDELREFTSGTVTTTANSTTATTSADFSASISAGQFFRVDGDRIWRKISSISTTTLTLENAYPTTNSAAAYTVCDTLDIPQTHHQAVFYGACALAAEEQGESRNRYQLLYQNELEKMMKRRNRKRFGRRVMKRYYRGRRFR